jgi:hypothetical protein
MLVSAQVIVVSMLPGNTMGMRGAVVEFAARWWFS